MKKRSYRKKYPSPLRSLLLSAAVFALVLGVVLIGLRTAAGSVSSEGVKVAEEAVRRAAVSCYATEGAYPESYDYLRERYGLQINEELYAVHYSIFASNIMPDISVTEK